MATYYISGIWLNAQNDVTDVMLHQVSISNQIANGIKKSTAYVCSLLTNNDIYSITWDYEKGAWLPNHNVICLLDVRKRLYIKTKRNRESTNLLHYLIQMDTITDN